MSKRHSAPLRTGMVLAAGRGERMRPITATLPKPLVKVAGRALLDYALDRLAEAGVATAVVNVHHLADLVETHLSGRRAPRIVVSDERDRLLETGGGVKRALPLLGADDFWVLNSDSLWIDGRRGSLAEMREAWDPDRMDLLLLLAATPDSFGYDGRGDFVMDPEGRLTRRGEREVAPFVYTGAAVCKPGLFADTPEGPFSLNLLFDRAIAAGRLYGHRLEGQWLHVGTPDAIAGAQARLEAF
jgi:N-acetyl-alpha-D-muramate 1-phosphate uridylyltransferase